VVRPLRQAAGSGPGDSGHSGAGSGRGGTPRAEPATDDPSLSLADELWQLARAATALRVRCPEMTELAEATAALQDLAVGLADEPEETDRLGELAALQAELSPGIQVMADGPYLVNGARAVLDGLGQPLPVRPQLALCRCGASAIKPLCDGTHAATGFTGAKDPDRELTIFEWMGGLPALTRMTRLFYGKHIPAGPLLAPLFASMSPDHPERVATWLAEVFGGPKLYSTQYGGYPRMISQHLGKQITEGKRARWVELLQRAAADAGLPNDPEFRSVFGSYIEWGTRLAVENSQTGAKPPEHMPMPRWDWNTAAGPPGSRVSALAPPEQDEEPEPSLPAAGETVRFGQHIKPLFRRRDRRSMSFAFDLWSHDDVSRHAEAILGRLRDGKMPCDGPWPQDKIEVFARWASTSKPE
jgi:truncated hemoglobin YjbI